MELDIIKALEEDEIIKSWSTDLMRKHPGGGWITINGAKVFLGASGNVVAGPKEVKEKLNEGKKDGGEKKESEASKKVDKPEKKEDSKSQLKHFIGDEGMFRGGEFKIVSHQSYPNRYTIQELDENGKSIGKPDTINQKDFEASFSKFPKEEKKEDSKNMGAVGDALSQQMKDTKERLDSEKTKKTYQKKGDDGLDQFRELARKAKDVEDFMNKVRNIKDVPSEVSKEFMDKYGDGGKLSIEQTSKKFMDEVKGGKKDSDLKKQVQEKIKGFEKIPAKQFNQANDFIYLDKNSGKYHIVSYDKKELIEIKNKTYLKDIADSGVGGISKITDKKPSSFTGYDVLKNPPMVGDKLKMRIKQSGGVVSGTQGEIYETSTSGKTFRLKDDYGNKNEKWYNIQDFKTAKITRDSKEIKKSNIMEPDIIKALGGIEEDNFTEYQETIMKGFDLGVYDEDMLEKAIGHKYFKREGSPGKYKYYYTEAQYKKEKGEKGGKVTAEGKTNTEKAQFHREQMAIANKKGDGAKYHFHMGKRDMYKKMAEKETSSKKETGKESKDGGKKEGGEKVKKELDDLHKEFIKLTNVRKDLSDTIDNQFMSAMQNVSDNKLGMVTVQLRNIKEMVAKAKKEDSSKGGLKVGGMIQMFKDEPKLKITKVHEWGDKGNTYDLESSDGKIKRNNISGTKFI